MIDEEDGTSQEDLASLRAYERTALLSRRGDIDAQIERNFQVLAEKAKEPNDVPRNQLKILVIDDEPLIAKGMEIQLRINGYEPRVFTDSVEALNEIRNNPDSFDLVISDHKMPNVTGSDLLRECRRVAPDKPFVFCSGHLGGRDEVSSHADACFLKPVRFHVLSGAIERLLHQPVDCAFGETSSPNL